MIPPSTVSIQTPTVVVDKNAEKHCVEPIAAAFVKYLHTPDAQDVFQSVGYQRPIDVAAAKKGNGSEYPPVPDLFTTDDLGGWDKLTSDTVFGPNGAFTKALPGGAGIGTITVQATAPQRSQARARRRPGAALGRWRSGGRRSCISACSSCCPWRPCCRAGSATAWATLQDAFCSRSARQDAIRLTLEMAVLTAIINGVFGTLLAYICVRVRFPGREAALDGGRPPVRGAHAGRRRHAPGAVRAELRRSAAFLEGTACRSSSRGSGSCWRCCS